MARGTLALATIGNEGSQQTGDITPTAIVAADDLQFDNSSGKVLLFIVNGGTSGDQTVTIPSVACSHGRTQDLTVTVAQGKVKVCGPFPPPFWNQAPGLAYANSTTEDALTLYAVKMA